MICDRCYQPVDIGEHGQYLCPLEPRRASVHVSGDECDYIDHNLGPEPIRIRSWSERRAIMAARGLVDFQYDVTVPDGMAPNPQRPSRWGAYRQCDPAHLAWLAAKLSTGTSTKETPHPDAQIHDFTPIVEEVR